MYASFFGLRELPFNNTPDPRFFYSTPDHEEALASLIYAIEERKGFVLLTGEVGAGKTLVTRLMLRHFNERITFASINHTQVSANELLRCICGEFHIDVEPEATNAEMIRYLHDFLVARFADNQPVVLMLDEAQALSREAFEQVRMIGNLEADDAKLLQIVIVGQPELRERFEANDMRQLRQRIFRSFHLSALNRKQTEGYIHHRLGVGGAQYPERVFNTAALDAIYEYAQGLPRLINTVCDNALLSAYASDHLSVDGPFVQRVIEQMMTVAQGGPHFASPRVPTAENHPRRRAADQQSSAPAAAAPVVPAPAPVAPAAAPVVNVPPVIDYHAEAQQRVNDMFQRGCEETGRRMIEQARNICDHTNRRMADQARTVCDDAARHLAEHARRIGDEFLERISQEAERIHRQSGAGAVENAERLETSLHALVSRAVDLESCIAPGIERLHDATRRLRSLLEETCTTTEDMRETLSAARTTNSDAQQTLRQLADQAGRTGRLSVTLRQVYDKLNRKAADIDRKVAELGSGSEERVSRRHIDEHTRHLETAIDTNRSAIAEVRTLIAAVNSASAAMPKAEKSTAGPSRSANSKLGERVQALSELVESVRAAKPPARAAAV